MANAYVKLPEMTWPHPEHALDLGWRLRYAPEFVTRGDQLTLASIVDAYAELIRKPIKRRNVVIRLIKAAVNG